VEFFRHYFDVFGPGTNRDLLRLAIDKSGHFRRSKTTPSPNYPGWRRSTVIYDDQLREIRERLWHELMTRLPEVLENLRMPRFDIGGLELQLTSHNDGEYYKWHTDNGTALTAPRTLSFVYYFHAAPKRFTGGELVIYQPAGDAIVVEPRNDSLVMFGSHTKHEVRTVVCPSGKFEHGRFTLNGWIHRKQRASNNDWFGYQMFSPYRARRVAAPVQPVDAATSARCASLLDLYGRLQPPPKRPGAIDELTKITHRRFIDDYYSRNRPVIIKGMLKNSRAVRTWSPKFFARHFPDAPVDITARRDADPDYERHFRGSLQSTTMGELVERLTKEPDSNDFYLVARNYFFDSPAFHSLHGDLKPPPQIIDAADRGLGWAKMWFGPKGTVTPLHHDLHSILFTQVHGRKQFRMIASHELPNMYLEDKYYSAVDIEKPDPARFPRFPFASIQSATVEPGDVLFIPVGWWHWVKSLDVSISVTFSRFRVPGQNTEWRPEGAIL
jgi:Rps23 Pro-64 3,4-dihydroxylase Tpa1-like proline 4-hydroxylase